MRISDWSSDVCSSDLGAPDFCCLPPPKQLDVIDDLHAAAATNFIDDLNEVAGRDCVLDGLCRFLGVGGRSERERHEDGQATLLQERRCVAPAGSVHWRALPRPLWLWMHCIARYRSEESSVVKGGVSTC